MNKWTIMKRLNLLMALALTSVLFIFLVYVDGRKHLSLFERLMGGLSVALFFLFLVLLIYWLRRSASDVRTLNGEIHAMEGGDLTREITGVYGDGEIAMLAESIDEFRKSMKGQLATIEQLEKNNRLMTEEIAHDLRTPLTSLIMYLDFAQGELGDREPQAAEYITKAKGRAIRLKSLLDKTFNAVTVSDDQDTKKQKIHSHEVLRDSLRDLMTYLESEGFMVRLHVDVFYGQNNLCIIREALERVFTNLASNIMKYADKEEEILIRESEEERHVEVRIVNRVLAFEEERPSGTGVGTRIVRRMMDEMGGEYYADEADGKYTTVLRFAKA